MAHVLLAADPDEGKWSVIAQADNADDILDSIDPGDPSLRILINTENFITFETGE